MPNPKWKTTMETVENKESEVEAVALPAQVENDQRRPISKFVHEHPVMTIAGGIAIGIAAAALIPKSNRQKVVGKASKWSGIVSTAALAMAREALERADSAREDLRRQADSIGGNVTALSGRAADRATQTGQTIVRKVSDIGAKLRG